MISNKLVKYIEAPYLPVKLSEVPEGDYIVVLSGMVHFVKDNVSINYPNLWILNDNDSLKKYNSQSSVDMNNDCCHTGH